LGKRVIVIGGGPGGYVAAIRASQLGAAVTLVEKNKLGGTCLNVGCIPTKALLHSAELYTAMRHEAPSIGIFADNLRFDWQAIIKRKNDIVNYLVECVGGLMQSNGIERVSGEARLVAPNAIEVGGRLIEADAVVIATGSEAVVPRIQGMDSNMDNVVTSDGALSFETLPQSIVIAGGGVIGVEFASIFASFGVTATVVEMLPQILPNIDTEIASILRR
jgi:dihydrolipoamide dehydrogenase